MVQQIAKPATWAELIEDSMRQVVDTRATLKYLFFGGKGGVGKTVMAGAAAVGLARRGRRVPLVSTNPVHSLSGLLDQNVFGRPTAVTGVESLWAHEIDTRETIERSKREIKEKIDWFLKYAEIRTKAGAFVESATMNPAFEESAMFESMIDVMFRGEYEVYVFDTAPAANARRLLGMSAVYSMWVQKMVQSREEARSLRRFLSYSKKEEADPLLDSLLRFRDRIGTAKRLLTDASLTSFFFITLPEALPIAVIRWFIAWFHDFGIPIGGVIINGVIERGLVSQATPEFVLNRIEMQESYRDEIARAFPGMVRAVIPLFETEVRGVSSPGWPGSSSPDPQERCAYPNPGSLQSHRRADRICWPVPSCSLADYQGDGRAGGADNYPPGRPALGRGGRRATLSSTGRGGSVPTWWSASRRVMPAGRSRRWPKG